MISPPIVSTLRFQPVVIVGRLTALTQFVADGLDEELADEARLARPRNARDAREDAQGNIRIQTIKIVARDSAKLEPAAGVSGRLGNPDGLVEEVGSRPGLPHVCEARQRAAVHDLAALRAGVGTDVDDPVRMPHDVEFVLDDEERISGRLQAFQGAQQRLGVRRMQSGRGLVQDVHDPEQIGPHLRRQSKPLQLARRQRRRAALGRQIAETEVEQHLETRRHVFGDPLHDQSLLGMVGEVPFPAVEMPAEHAAQLLQRQSRNFRDIHSGESDRERLGLEPLAFADRQSELERNCATRRFIIALCVVAKVCSTYFRAPVKVP